MDQDRDIDNVDKKILVNLTYITPLHVIKGD